MAPGSRISAGSCQLVRSIWVCSLALLFAALALLWAGESVAGTEYVYDDLGRVIQATQSNGSVTSYRYDANGNIVAINRLSGTTLSISGFSPQVGHVGSAVSIAGSGFSTTPQDNAVTIGGAAASVTSATAMMLTITVPAEASTGPIAVTVAGATAVSAQSMIVLRPSITSFSPAAVNAGGSVTVTGTNLNLVPGGTTFTVGGTPTVLNSLTNTKAVFVAPASGSGFVQALTSYGNATSATRLIVLPPAIAATNVIATASLPQGGTASVDINQAGKYGVFSFDGSTGQYVTVQVGSFAATPSNSATNYIVYSPTNAVLASGPIGGTGSIHLPQLPTEGTYLVAFTSTGTLQVTATLEVNTQVTVGTGSISITTAAADQSKRVTFTGTAGQNIGIGLQGLTFSPGSGYYASIAVRKPDGTNFATYTSSCGVNTGGCALPLSNLPVSGTYTIIVWAAPGQTMSARLTVSEPVSGSLVLDTPQDVSLVEGQFTALTFAATAGQTVALNLGSVVPGDKYMDYTVYGPTGAPVAGPVEPMGGWTFNLENLAAGTYTLRARAYYGGTATMRITLASGTTAALSVDGTSTTVTTTVPDQLAYLTFSGTAGQNIGIGLRGLTFSPGSGYYAGFVVRKPDGTNFASYTSSCGVNTGGCALPLLNLPVSGTYSIAVWPAGGQTMSFRLTLSEPVTGSLALNVPQNVTLGEGQFTALTFVATAGQTVAVSVGSIATSVPWWVDLTVRGPTGTWSNSTNGGSVGLYLASLPAGTYTVQIKASYGQPASMQVTLQ